MIRVYVVPPHPNSTNLRLRWKVGRKWRERSAKTSNPKEAERAAGELEKQLNEGRAVAGQRIKWADFCTRYEREHLGGLSAKTMSSWVSVKNHIDTLMGWQYADEANDDSVSAFTGLLRDTGIRETSIATHLRQLRTALNWGTDKRLLPKVRVKIPRRGTRATQMRGRPLTEAEFKRMLAAAGKVRPGEAEQWQRYMTGLWLSGLRLGESLILSWDDSSPLAVDLSGEHPRFRIWSEGEKGRKDRLLPMTPDFAKWLLKTPAKDRKGLVFDLPMRHPVNVSDVISEIGRKAKVEVNSATGKYASAQDFRRSFGTRWSKLVKPMTLQLLMRHEDIKTTMAFYVSQDTDEIAAQLWEEHG